MKGQTLGAFIKLMIFTVVTVLATAVLAVTISNRTFGSTQSFRCGPRPTSPSATSTSSASATSP
jgi:hypothetical protein